MRLPYLTGLQKIAGERSSTFVPDPDRLLEQVAGGRAPPTRSCSTMAAGRKDRAAKLLEDGSRRFSGSPRTSSASYWLSPCS